VGGGEEMILAIIQARMSSERLPGKVLMDLAGKPMIQWVIDACEESKLLDHVIVATSAMASDNRICDYLGDGYFRGSLDDVLDRFYQAVIISSIHPTHIVRLTADCPLLTGEIIDSVIRHYLHEGLDYILNDIDGVDVEIFPYGELLRAHKLATSQSDREHVTPYIKRYAGALDGEKVNYRRYDVPEIFSVDTMQDLERMGEILCSLNQKDYLKEH
jgi:spore coat polysaccharide biosynthesis protein SpsF (cytidylyltransferase family)